MKWTVRIIQGLLTASFLMFGSMKLAGTQMQVDAFNSYGYPVAFMYIVGLIEVLAAIGLAIGFKMPRIGFYSAGALALTMIGAVITHLQAGQGMGVATMPLVLFLLSLLVFWGRRSDTAAAA